MSSNPPSATEQSGQKPRITAVLATQGGSPVFKLGFGSETVPLLDSGSLNRWTAAGIVERHQVTLSSEGVAIDGRSIAYADPHGCERLESLLNRPPSKSPPPRARPSEPPPSAHLAPRGEAEFHLGDKLHVTRDGFEFHVGYVTRFGENKTDKLERALEILQNMRVFRPHISLQKSGIRLVVTRWDGESFVEEPGIDNLEHASPEQVEALIKSKLIGGIEPAVPSNLSSPAHTDKPAVVRVQVQRRPHDARFHLVLQFQDGRKQDGPLLIRPNMAKLAAEKLFRGDVVLSMTALNDRMIIEQHPPGTPAKQIASFALITPEDGAKLEDALNLCLRHVDSPASPEVPPSTQPLEVSPPPVVTVREPFPVVTPSVSPSLEEKPLAEELAPLPPPKPLEPPASPSESAAAAATTSHPSLEFLFKDWSGQLFRMVEAAGFEEVNNQVFTALRERFDCPMTSNDHGFPSFTVSSDRKDQSPLSLEAVLTPHYLLCNLPFGYLRFGPETRLFLTRLDDYISFPYSALRGSLERSPDGSLSFVVSDAFAAFLHSHQERSYGIHFGHLLTAVADVSPMHHLLWPASREEQLFQVAAATAKSYGLPITRDSIVLDPHSSVFIGFRKISPNGIEFCDGEDFVRFTPVDFVCSDDGLTHHFAGVHILNGWALDAEGRVCALYRADSGFVPPAQVKLLRFLSEQELESEGSSLTTLAMLPSPSA